MPYIKQKDRAKFDAHIEELLKYDLLPGDLNYIFSRLAHGQFNKSVSYTNGNQIVGAFECAKMEFYRRWLVPYEEEKIKENGDI